MAIPTSEPGRIERDLDQTRSRLGSHLSELQDRLSPGQVLDDLMGYFRGSEGAEFGRSLLENVRGNPMPAALTGIGLAWLMASNPRGAASQTASGSARAPESGSSASGWSAFGSSASDSQRSGPHLYGREDYGATIARAREAENSVLRDAGEADHSYLARVDEVRGQAIGLARHSEETTDSFGQRVRDALAAAQQAVSGTAHDVRDQVGGALGAAGGAIGSLGASVQSTAQDAVQYAGNKLSQGGQAAQSAVQSGSSNLVAAFVESPVLLGALGLAAGALLGALLPQSDQEEAALGGIAGQARDTATSLAKTGLERGRSVAQAVVDKGRDSAEAHGLAGGKSPGELVDAALSGELAGQAKTVLQDVLRTGDEAVRKAASEVAPDARQESRS